MKFLNSKLKIENTILQNIARKYGTPAYCYSYKQLRENVNNFKRNFKSITPLICFAIKSNTNLNLIKQVGRINSIFKNRINNKNSVDILVLKEKLTLRFNENIDLASQRERILKKIENINKLIIVLKKKLKNKAYVTNAPKEIVQNDKNLIDELTIEDEKLRSIVSSIN